jgi:glycosyltransferase involved in cell wall biosynthesis
MSARPRVAFVVQRCGDEIAGGAEALCLASARTMAAHWDCEILTTCARDARSWANEYPPGETIDGGVRIVRFAVDVPRDARAFDRASRRIASDSGSLAEQEAWMRLQGPYASGLFAHLERNGGTYDCVFFFSYLYATTYFGLPLVADRAILVALAHDEWTLELPLFDRIFASARACAFVSEEERLLVETRFASLSSLASLVRVAIEPRVGDAAHFREAFRIGEPFMLYVGRVEPAKGVDDLLAHFLALRAIDFKPMSLVLAGPIAMELPERSDVIALGRIAEDEKWNALAAADFVVVPSAYESLSIVALEAWAAGRAVLANGSSAVLVGQCRRSGGGLWYAQEREFVDLARSGLVGEAQRLGVQGARYVARTFTAASARDSLLAAYAAVHSAA